MTSAEGLEPVTAARCAPSSMISRPAGAAIPNQRRESTRRPPRRPSPPTRPTGASGAPADVGRLTDLARAGVLRSVFEASDDATRRALHAAAYTVAYPVVFDVVTRRVERRRGHGRCLRGLRDLAGPCLDCFYDDVEALIEHLFASATPIDDLPAWLAFWAPRAAVDGHRRRRGAIGALQRPRMTAALAAGLGHDPWLMNLALEILTWVGVPATAGAELWPLDEWAQRRAVATGDPRGSTPAVVAAEVDRVLAVMRERPQWYADHVERPLGHKPAPVAAPPGDSGDQCRPLRVMDKHDVDDAYTGALAGIALEAIGAALRRGDDPAATVVHVLTTLFLGGSTADGLDRAPCAGPARDERLSALLADPAAVARIVDGVLRIVREVQE